MRRLRKGHEPGTILIIILIVALFGGFSGLGGGPFYGTGYGGGGFGLVLLIIVLSCSGVSSRVIAN
ncbi:DUF3309 family protein [Mesorhizobium sp. CO1-1-8]|uniref:DUF3309 family protein n=1 Tax=Mesorhizobium sp. CO1-1-8 TaxID=2876631 RepID=UPI001CD09441|nr:DUF3309 family protein [Mesorhizobium sp. CO1-1-8]MBZ9775257.1 DUF3309 family protein [Mesorhizobium sp. CO1-1-8]